MAVFGQNAAKKQSGIYQGFRTDTLFVAPSQNIPKSDGKVASVIAANDKGQSFYEHDLTNAGTFVNVDTSTVEKEADIKTNGKFGDLYNICVTAKMDAANAAKLCWGVAMFQNAKETTGIVNRCLFDNTAKTASLTIGDKANKTIDTFEVNTDLIMGSFFGAVGKSTDGAWCSGVFYNEVKVATGKEASVEGQTGFGPRGKCTWQFVAEKNTHGPIIELVKTPRVDALMQVIEWFDTTYTGTNGIMDATKAAAGPSFIAKTDQLMLAKNGVFLNPITKSQDTKSMTAIADPDGFSTVYSQNNALASTPNSIGTVAYYERDEGQAHDLIYNVDSIAVTSAYGVYNAEKANYVATKATYDTDKAAYETAQEDKKKKPETKLPTRPNMPTPTGAYSGPTLRLSGQVATSVTDTWGTVIKGLKGSMDGLIATGMTKEGRSTYAVADLTTTFHNRVNYVVMSAANDKDKVSGVGVTFGRLGQAIATNYKNGSPFMWTTAKSTSKPGMQLSILPEYLDKNWADWTVTTPPTFNYGIKTFAALTDFDAPTAPGAATAIADSAVNMAAASVVAVAAVASTML